MDKTRETRRSTTSMAASNGLTKRRQRTTENIRGRIHHEVAMGRDRQQKKDRDPESLNRSKRRRSERFTLRNEKDVADDSSDDSMEDDAVHHDNQAKNFPSVRVPKHAASSKDADEMIGVLVPRKARSACVKRSHDCRTSSGSDGVGFGDDRRRPLSSPGSHSFEVVSPSSSTLSVKHNKKNVNVSKSRIPKPPKSFGTVEDDLEIEIAEVLSGLKKQPHNSRREHHSESSLKSSEVKDAIRLKTEGDDSSVRVDITCEADIADSTKVTKTPSAVSDVQGEEETPSILDGVQENHRLNSRDSAPSKGLSESTQLEKNRDESNCNSKLEIDLMVPPTVPSSPGRVSLIPLVSDCYKRDGSVKNQMIPEDIKQKKVEKREWLNFEMERPNQEIGRESILRLQNLAWSQPQQAKSAQKSSALPLPVAVGSSSSGLHPQGCALIQTSKAMDGSNISSTLVLGSPFSASQPRPKRCATHFFIARNIQLHQHFVKTNHLSTPNNGAIYLKGGDLKPAAVNPSFQESSPILSLNSQADYVNADNISALKDRASESGHFAITRQKKPQPSLASSSIVPTPDYIFPTNHHMQPTMAPYKTRHPAKSPRVGVGSASVNFGHPSSSPSEASSPYFTVLPNNAYSFQLSSTVRGGTPTQASSLFNGSFYSPKMFQQPSDLNQRQSQAQMESKTSSSSSSFHRQPQLQVSINSLSSQPNVLQHCQRPQKSEAKAAGDNSDSRGSHTQKGRPYGQIMTVPVQPQNFSMSFASFPSGAPPANLNFSSSGYHIVSAPPVHQKNHQASESKTGGGSCSSNAEDTNKTIHGKPPAMMTGQTLVFDNPSRTLNFVSGTWPPAATTVNGDPSMFTHHLTQRQQQSGRSKMMTHSQADSVIATSSQRKNPATSSLTSCNSLNLKQFQSQQQIRTHGQTQISFAVPSEMQHGKSGGTSYSVTGSASLGKAENSKVTNSTALQFSPGLTSSAQAQDQTENSVSGSTQKTSPVCGRTVPSIITSCPGHLSELKY